MSEVIQKANEFIVPIIEELGYEVVEVEYKKILQDMNLTFYIYHKNGITLEDCEKVNNVLEEPLDRFDITNGAPYVLNISSPGLDRPIVSEADFRRSLDTEVEVLLKEKIGKKTKLWGILTQYDEQKIVLTKDNTNTEILRPNIKLVRPYIKF